MNYNFTNCFVVDAEIVFKKSKNIFFFLLFIDFRHDQHKPIGFENSIFTIIMVVLALLVIFVIAYFIFRILKNMKQPHYDGSFKRLLRPHTESTVPSKIQPGKKMKITLTLSRPCLILFRN